jgi:hypothetical protein
MIEIKKGIVFTDEKKDIQYTISLVTKTIVQVTYEGEMVEFTREEFESINKLSRFETVKNDKKKRAN